MVLRGAAAHGRGEDGQAVPHLRQRWSVPVCDRGQGSAWATTTTPSSSRACSTSATGSAPDSFGPASTCSCPKGPTSSPRTSGPSAKPTASRSAARCPNGPASWRCPASCSTTTRKPGASLGALGVLQAADVLDEAVARLGEAGPSSSRVAARAVSARATRRGPSGPLSEEIMIVAGIQHDIVWEDPQANFARLAPMIATAAHGGARLIVCTEMFSTRVLDGHRAHRRTRRRPEHAVPRRPSARERRLGLRIDPGAGRCAAAVQPVDARGAGRRSCTPTPRSIRSPTVVSTSTTARASRSSPSTSKAFAPVSSSATTCASPTSSGRSRPTPTVTSSPRTGPPRGARIGRRCSRRVRSRTRPMWWASTESATAASSRTQAIR